MSCSRKSLNGWIVLSPRAAGIAKAPPLINVPAGAVTMSGAWQILQPIPLNRVEPVCVSDHLCWGRHGGRYAHDLLPLPYTEEALAHVISRVRQVQDMLGRQMMLENVSSYVEYASSTMTEWEFLARIAGEADCGILLDVNNVYVSARNHGFDPDAYLAGIPVDRVGQFHLAGHSDHGTYVLDTHDAPVVDAVWELYRSAVRRFGRVPALIEWDDHVPELERLVEESHRAREVEAEALA